MVEATVEFVKTRKQFGVAIGGFQAVQHKLANMHLKTEAMRAMAHFASWSAEESKDQLTLASASALAFACEHAGTIVEDAIQLHGGIGFTWEFDLHLFLRRAKMLEILFAPTKRHSELILNAI